ncbi:MAG: XamI family restriction endonuclease [Planctomycetaceae bacterium]
MAINADKPLRWKDDIRASVDQFNKWFMVFAPKAFREARLKATEDVEKSIRLTNDLTKINASTIAANPQILPTLRMATCPPLARDRLVGLAYTTKNLVYKLEDGAIPPKLPAATVNVHLVRIANIISKMLDRELFPWLAANTKPTDAERHRASTIVADRLCGAVSDPIVRNAQEQRQLALIQSFLEARGYGYLQHPQSADLTTMERGTFSFRLNVRVGEEPSFVNIPVDVVIQAKKARKNALPLFVEAKSAGDFTNVNKRRKEEAAKMKQLRATYGTGVRYILFLCGYFDTGYLGYEAAEGMDWVWEHRIGDLAKFGI